jgi:hypothetical protein
MSKPAYISYFFHRFRNKRGVVKEKSPGANLASYSAVTEGYFPGIKQPELESDYSKDV